MTDEDKPKRKRSNKPAPGVIDLEATEIERAPVPGTAADEAAPDEPLIDDLDPLAEEPPPQADDPELFEAEPRSPLGALIAAGVAGAAIALSTFLLLLAAGLLPIGGGHDFALESRVAGLEGQIDKATNAPQIAAPVPVDTALRDRVEVLKQEVAKLRAAPAPVAAADPALATRLSELAVRVDTLAAASANTGGEAVEQLKKRLDEIAAKLEADRAPDPALGEAVTRAKGASVLSAFAILDSAAGRGVPYADALAALRQLLPNADFAGLEADAEKGLVSATVLARRFEEKLDAAPPPEGNATGFVDKLAEGARGLVRIRPVAGSPEASEIRPGDPWSARGVIAARLKSGDYSGAAKDWEQLDPVAREATADEAARLKARLDADEVLNRLRRDVFARAEARP